MPVQFATKVKGFLPPANLLPLLIAYMLDSLAISSYWIFLSIWLDTEIIPPDAKYHYLMLTAVISIPAFVSILGSSFFSSFSDKTGKRKEIMFLARILLMAQCILLIFFNDTSIQILLILAVFSVHNVFYIMHNALITIICHPDKRGEVSSFQMFFASLGWMIGSSVSGLIYANLGMIGGLSIGAGFALLTGITVLFSPTKPDVTEETLVEADQPIVTPSNAVSQIKPPYPKIPAPEKATKSKNYWQILTQRNILIFLVMLAIIDFGTGPFNAMASVYLSKVGLTDDFIGISNMIATFLGMIFQLFIGKLLDRKGRRPVFLAAMIGYPIIYLLIYLLSGSWIAVFIIYSYPLYALRNPSANAIMSDLTDEKERSRGMSLLSFEQSIFLNTGSFLGAFIADISTKGILILPVFPLAFGIIVVILAFFYMKETNRKLLKGMIPVLAQKE